MKRIAEHKMIGRTIAAATLFAVFFCLSCPAIAQSDNDSAVSENLLIVNNVWADVPLAQAFRDISIETGAVIATCPHVPDPLISLDAGQGKPLEECLRQLIEGRGLAFYKKNENFYLVCCGSPSCPSFMSVANPKRLYLKYINSKHLRSSLPQSIQQYVTSGERANEALIYAQPEVTDYIMQIVNKLDTPQPQVVLEVLVVELSEEGSEEFGIDWQYSDPHNAFSIASGLGAFTGLASYTSVPQNQITQLLLTLKLLVEKKKAAIRSRPRVATLNGQEAAIEISLDEYFAIAKDFGAGAILRTELQEIKSGVLLKMTPFIGDDNLITVNVFTEVSDVDARQNQMEGNQSGTLPVVRRRKADTHVRVREGDAIVIGGLIETTERTDDKAVPFFSSIPVVGGIFKRKESSMVKKEVVLFITPRLIRNGTDPFANRHNKIEINEELKALREVADMMGGQSQPHNTDVQQPDAAMDHNELANIEDQIKGLKEVAALFYVQVSDAKKAQNRNRNAESSGK